MDNVRATLTGILPAVLRPQPARLGVYEVTAQIGADGTDEVYCAPATTCKRSMFITVLPASEAGEADRPSSACCEGSPMTDRLPNDSASVDPDLTRARRLV